MSLLDRFLVRGTVERAETVTGRIRRIRIASPEKLTWTPGQQIHVHIDGVFGPRRTYSVWDLDESGVELRILDHGDGPGARWARDAEPGREVLFGRPEGGFVTRQAAYHVFAGEETASCAFGPMLRALPEGATAYGVVEVDSEDDRLPLSGAVTWKYRAGAAAAASDGLVAGVRELDLPAEPGVAYVAGEARTVQAVRRHLVEERGWPRRSVLTKPFWAPGKKGMD